MAADMRTSRSWRRTQVFTPFRVPLRSLSILCDPKKETDRCFFIDPFADFGFAGRVQSPDLVLDPFDIDGHPYIYHTYDYYHDIR
jgi:hypothetical protein